MNKLKTISIPVIVMALFFSCSEIGNKENIPRASGRAGEVILVMDSAHWKSPLGDEITKTFRQEVAGLPRPEPEFNVRYIMPEEFNGILKMAQNIIIVAILENYSSNSERVKNYFTPNSLKRINEEPDLFLLSKQNEWAKGQEILFLFGKTEDALTAHIAKNSDKLKAHFNNIERRRLEASLYKSKELKELGNVLMENHQFSLRIPFGWRIEFEDDSKNFIWLRLPGIQVDRNIWIYYKDYTSDEVFEDPVAFRNSITKQFIFDDKDTNDTSYVVVETLVPAVKTQANFNDKYAIEVKGLWKTNNLSMGGPFVSYVFVDQEINRVYYLDGFIYSPSKPQREFIRELETILWTFQTKSEAAPPT